ncbi:hypothetical protein SAMN06265222_10587 [Neorhodopirellula lusitana]|uniref:Uncharacterized protein n=1 Tax=Neorhodopirellula lusitana TaxID=445327 RepID=A0ABY1Q1D4_9BACT|nr:hypothetical protein [Neorhodopirellula lusitana]SMP56099.1 hypothetical protein SAMN06265222_10587 [Neorhodopirellula lusitana]
MIGSSIALFAVTHTSDLAPEFQAPIQASGIPMWVYLLAACLAAALVGGYISMTRMSVPALSSVDELTLELCRAHGIGMQHRLMLEHVAKLAQLECTADLFLSPKLFDQAVSKASEVKRLRGGQRGLIFEARQCLFN